MIPLGILGSARVSSGATVLASDNFNRADSTTTLGTSSGGQAWTARSGTWGINSNGGYVVTGSDVVATVDVGRSQDFTANISMNSAPNWPGLVVRCADASNYYWVELGGGSGTQLSRRMAGARTVLAETSNTRVAWQSVSVVVTDNGSGTRFVVTVDGVPRIDYTDSTAGRPAGNHVGMYAQPSSGVPAFDNFTVTAP